MRVRSSKPQQEAEFIPSPFALITCFQRRAFLVESDEHVRSVINWIICIRPTICQSPLCPWAFFWLWELPPDFHWRPGATQIDGRCNFGCRFATFNYILLLSTLALAYMSAGRPLAVRRDVAARKRSKVSAWTALSALDNSEWIINVEIRSSWNSPPQWSMGVYDDSSPRERESDK